MDVSCQLHTPAALPSSMMLGGPKSRSGRAIFGYLIGPDVHLLKIQTDTTDDILKNTQSLRRKMSKIQAAHLYYTCHV